MCRIHELLARKEAQDVWHIAPDASVFEALDLMAEKDIGGLPVTDGARLVGFFSERDYARRIILLGRSSRETKVHELMVTPVPYVRPEQDMDVCMALMTRRRVRHLPVLDGGELIGIISIGDVVRQIVSEKEFVIEQLEHYIRGAL